MTEALRLSRPVVAPRFQPAWWWLLTLLPGTIGVLEDLAHGTGRPGAWLLRLLPALVMLGVVAGAHRGKSAMATRLRKELRLTLAPGLFIFSMSGLALVTHLLPEAGAWAGFVRFLPWMLSLLSPFLAVLYPMAVEQERGTLAALVLSPRGARAFAEKFALGALLVVLSWLQLQASLPPEQETWWFTLCAHVLALATAPTWFFFAQKGVATLGLSMLSPMFVAAPAAWFGSFGLALGSVAVYGGVLLAALPVAVRRGVAMPAFGERFAFEVPGASWASRLGPPLIKAELVSQRETVVLALVGCIAFGVLQAWEGTDEGASVMLFIMSAMVAALSPSLAFAEAQRQGTLEPLLVVRPRSAVFRFKVACSGLVTLGLAVLVPLALQRLFLAGPHSAQGDVVWLSAMGFVWAAGVATSVHAVGAAQSMSATVGVSFLWMGALGFTFGAVTLAVTSWGGNHGGSGLFVAAVFGGAAAIAAFVAWRRFMLRPASVAVAGAAMLLQAAVLGAASTF